jgi:hypothetical protein
MTPQVVSAGKIRLHNSTENADRHFENLRKEYADALNRLRAFVDDAIDTGEFVRASESAMHRYTNHCEDAIVESAPQKMVDNTSEFNGHRVKGTQKGVPGIRKSRLTSLSADWRIGWGSRLQKMLLPIYVRNSSLYQNFSPIRHTVMKG